MSSNGVGHIIKMAAMPMYGKNLLKSSESKYYQICPNDDPGFTLMHFTARSNLWRVIIYAYFVFFISLFYVCYITFVMKHNRT